MTRQLFSIRSLMALVMGLGLTGLGASAALADDNSATATAESVAEAKKSEDGWKTIFNGKDLKGWKAAENPDSFSVEDGELVVKGPRGHLFYTGEGDKADFKNFEWKVEVMTKPKANSGLYFHTKYQDEGWPSKGYEVQVNNTHPDPKKTGGLYAVADVIDKSPAKDNEWFSMHIIVKGKRVIVKVNDKVVTDYIEPDNPDRDRSMRDRVLDSGTIAIQAHDPESVIHFRNIKLKLLPDDAGEQQGESNEAQKEQE